MNTKNQLGIMSDESFIEYILDLYKPKTEEEERELTLRNIPFLSLAEPKLEDLTCPDCHTTVKTSILRVFEPTIKAYIEIPVHHADYTESEDRGRKCVTQLMRFMAGKAVSQSWGDSESPDLANALRGPPILVEDHRDTLKTYASIFHAAKDIMPRAQLYEMLMPLLRE
jgi:hypothetical protein